MKKLFITMALVLCAAAASAQVVAVAEEIVVEEQQPKRRGWAGYETNRFFDNWEITVAGGAQIMVFNGTLGKDDFGSSRFNHINWQADFSLTKWFHPVMGARLQIQGGQYQNDTAFGNQYMKDPYIFTHMDFMVNLSNWIGGERDDRVYYAVPFAGFGYHVSGFTDKFQRDWGYGTDHSFAFTAGLLNKFRVCPALDIELELKAWMLPSSNMPSILNSGTQKVAAAYSATIGLTYRFNRRGFKQASPYTVEDVMAYQAVIADRDLALAAVQADNAELANDLAAANKAAKKAAAEAAAAKKAAEMAKWGPNPIPADQLDGNAYTDDIYLTGKGITFFNIGQTELSPKEKLRLDIIATQIKNAPKNKIYDRRPCRSPNRFEGREYPPGRAACEEGLRLPDLERRKSREPAVQGLQRHQVSVQDRAGEPRNGNPLNAKYKKNPAVKYSGIFLCKDQKEANNRTDSYVKIAEPPPVRYKNNRADAAPNLLGHPRQRNLFYTTIAERRTGFRG